MEQTHAKLERSVIRISVGTLVGLIALVVLWWSGVRAYEKFEQRHLVRRAAGFLSGGDLKNAASCALRSWQIEHNVGAARLLAEVTERVHNRSAIEWRREASQLNPSSVEDAIALATAALQYGELSMAERAFNSVPDEARDSAKFHAGTARLADARGDAEEAEKHWSRALELDPQNKTYILQVALSHLHSADSLQQAKGRAALETIRNDETLRLPATRALLGNAVLREDFRDETRAMAEQLQLYPDHTFADRLLYLGILQRMRDPQFTAQLTSVEEEAVYDTGNLATLLTWMNGAGLSGLALNFAQKLDPQQTTKWPVALALAEVRTRLSDWNGLEKALRNSNWGNFDYLRRAYLTRAFRQLGKEIAAEQEWEAAKKLATVQPSTLSVLIRTVRDWGWKSDAVELLWQLSKFPKSEAETLHNLYRYYAHESDTQGLYRVLARLVDVEPENATVQNNFSQIALLLNVDLDRARKIAAKLYNAHKDKPEFVSTYAFSWYSRGQAKQAVQIMSGLPANQIETANISVYYGIFLAASGESKRAQDYLARSRDAALLPEEKALVERATKMIAR